jgi:hypothetical protein
MIRCIKFLLTFPQGRPWDEVHVETISKMKYYLQPSTSLPASIRCFGVESVT